VFERNPGKEDPKYVKISAMLLAASSGPGFRGQRVGLIPFLLKRVFDEK
jgi:hypothetical protein